MAAVVATGLIEVTHTPEASSLVHRENSPFHDDVGRNQSSTGDARGFGVWVSHPADSGVDPVVWQRAAHLVLARAVELAPSAEVRIWTSYGSLYSGAGDVHWGGTPQNITGTGSHPLLDFDLKRYRTVVNAENLDRLVIDLATKQVTLAGKSLSLTPMEYELLQHLVLNCSRAVDRNELQHLLPGAALRSIDAYVGRIRRKLRPAHHAISTVRIGGYQFIQSPRVTVHGATDYCI